MTQRNLAYAFGIPAVALVALVSALFWALSGQQIKDQLQNEVLASVQFRGDVAANILHQQMRDLSLALDRQAATPQLQAWFKGDATAAKDPTTAWDFWLARTPDGREWPANLPIHSTALLGGFAEKETTLIIGDLPEQAWLVQSKSLTDPDGKHLGTLYQGISLSPGENLVAQLRMRSGVPTIALVHQGHLIGVAASRRDTLTKTLTHIAETGYGPVLDGDAFAVLHPMPDHIDDLSLLLVLDHDPLGAASEAHLRISLMVAAGSLLLVLALALLFRMRLKGLFQQVQGYVERTAHTEEVPEYTPGGLVELDAIGRAVHRIALEVHAERTQWLATADQHKEEADKFRTGEESLRHAVDALPEALMAVDRNGTVTLINSVAEQVTGRQRHEAMGRKVDKVLSLIHPQTREHLPSPLLLAMASRKVTLFPAQAMVMQPDGREHRIAGAAGPMPAGGAVMVFRDITEQSFQLHQEQQNQKMEAIGNLAGGIAHDFNNLLSAIIGYAELMQQDLREDVPISNKELLASVEHIIKVARQGADLSGQLQAFSPRGKMQTEVVDLHQIIGAVLKMVERTFDPHINLVKNLEAERVKIEGDGIQLENALMNLAINAREAMPEGGKLSVTTSVVQLDESFCRRQKDPIEPGEYLELSIADTGVGMSRELIERIFEPFYSTKDNGPGTGLGLAAVYATVIGHQGLITVYSEPEFGTVFKIHLPLAPTHEEAATQESKEEREDPVHGEGLVLLVEDENVVREIALTMLRQFGYGVIEAVNGKEGISKYIQFQEEIDLVILDIEMPVMGGRETLTKLKAINPNVRILIASGYSLDMESRDFFEKGGVAGFIQKPYLMADFSRLIAEILADQHPALD